jgi:hypothetical protein
MRKRVLGGPRRVKKKLVIKKNGGKVEPTGSTADKQLKDLKERYMKKNKKMSYKKGGPKYKKGGSKPDYLDFDKDGNTTEPMKSTYYGGGSIYTKKGKKIPGMQMGGVPRPQQMPPSEKDMIAMRQKPQPVSPSEPDFPPMEENQPDARGNLIQTPGMNRSMLTQEMIDAGYTADEKGFIDGPKNQPEMAVSGNARTRHMDSLGNRLLKQKGGAVYTKKGMRVPGMRKGR